MLLDTPILLPPSDHHRTAATTATSLPPPTTAAAVTTASLPPSPLSYHHHHHRYLTTTITTTSLPPTHNCNQPNINTATRTSNCRDFHDYHNQLSTARHHHPNTILSPSHLFLSPSTTEPDRHASTTTIDLVFLYIKSRFNS
ncbi:hypothetical protein RND81_03G062100 [Saponaria officinalis]|uniref:Uncharacterized protein n=1 Tax=Saponaria officinalis TaxID=3572 RepID=A0AAW1M623_SAPOF